jgi:tight adherence protein C
MTTSLVVALGLGTSCGVGLVIIGRAFATNATSLRLALRWLEGDELVARRAGPRRVSPAAAMAACRWTWLDLDRDLLITGRTRERHGVDKITCALALAATPSLVSIVSRVGGVSVGAGPVLIATVVAAPLGFVVPDLLLRSRADQRRRAFRHALSGYLDLVNVLLAGGAGVETALTAAADAGDGWAFGQLRDVLVRARANRLSPWSAFADLGRRLDIAELVELAASVELAGEQGARIRLSLVAKAHALRGRQAAEVEAEANAATEKMGVPTVLMFLGFLVLLGYPAAVTVMAGIGG